MIVHNADTKALCCYPNYLYMYCIGILCPTLNTCFLQLGDDDDDDDDVSGGTVVKAPCYKSNGRWFDPSWCHWNFLLT